MNSSVLSLLYGPPFTSVHDYWKNFSFDYTDLPWQSDVSVFNSLSKFVIAFLLRSKHLFFFFKYFILFFNFTILYWFCHISTWICHRYTCVPHPEPSSLLPPRAIPLGRPSAPAPSIQYRASNLDWRLISYMILNMFQCHSPKSSPPPPSPTESKRLFYTSVFLLLSRIQGYCYHLSKFHIYALVYCIGVFLSGLLHSL